MVFLENDAFLTELTKLFQKSRTTGTGSVKVTVKRYDGHDRPTPKPRVESKTKKGKGKGKPEAPAPAPAAKPKGHGHQPSELKISCLMRAKLHNRKISTIVTSKDINRFQVAYCNLLKGNMDGLKKVKKVKTKTKATT